MDVRGTLIIARPFLYSNVNLFLEDLAYSKFAKPSQMTSRAGLWFMNSEISLISRICTLFENCNYSSTSGSASERTTWRPSNTLSICTSVFSARDLLAMISSLMLMALYVISRNLCNIYLYISISFHYIHIYIITLIKAPYPVY